MSAPNPRRAPSQATHLRSLLEGAPTRSRAAWQGRSIPQEEAVIADVRASFSPADAVESKLRYLLRSSPIGVSHLMTTRLAANRPR